MKLIHISDLHLGKRVFGYSMHEDQVHILNEIVRITAEQKPDCVIIAGDIYDKPVPPAESVTLLDNFLVALQELGTPVLAIGGNHDSPERLAFASRIMSKSNIYLYSSYNGKTEPVTITDKYGKTDIFLLPFIKPSTVRKFFPDERISDYTDAVRCAVSKMPIDKSRRNILVAHQLVVGAEKSDSEEVSIGGLDNVAIDVLDDFDYVALGHIHRPQNIGSKRIRYCGSPLKYSFSEAPYDKSVTLVVLGEGGSLDVTKIPLVPLRDTVEIKGSYDELMSKTYYDGKSFKDDYLHITLTDEYRIPEAMAKLRTVYSHVMKLDYENSRSRTEESAVASTRRAANPLENFERLFKIQNGIEMTQEQREYVKALLSEIESERQSK